MKKFVFLPTLFAVVFGLALGFTLIFNQSARADPPPTLCDVDCVYEVYCSSTTGPLCTNPLRPHYAYSINGDCPDHPWHLCPWEGAFVGCCR